MTTQTENSWSDADRDLVTGLVRALPPPPRLGEIGGLGPSPEEFANAVLDALTAAGWRPPHRREHQPTGCTCPQVEVTPWPGYPAVERELIPGQPNPQCPQHRHTEALPTPPTPLP